MAPHHHGQPTRRWSFAGFCPLGRRASVRAASRSSRVSKMALAKIRRSASNQRSAGLSSGLSGGSAIFSIPSGQRTLPLVWLPLLSRTSPIRSVPVCLRNSSRKRWKQIPSTCGRNSTKHVPLTGSTAAYSPNQWYWWSHGGRLPNGHHNRRCVTFRPKRASSMAKSCSTASRETVSSFFKRCLIGGAGGLAVMWTSGLQLSLAPAKQLGNRIDAIGDVPGVAQIELCLVQPADVASPHLRLQTLPSLRREAFRCATSLRWRQQRRQAARAVALPPALNSSHTIAQHLRCLTDTGDPLFLKKTKQSQAIGSGLVTSRFLRGLQLRNIFLDQQRISSVHTQPPVPSTSLILNRDNTLALILIPTLPIFSLCRTSRFIRIGMRGKRKCSNKVVLGLYLSVILPETKIKSRSYESPL